MVNRLFSLAIFLLVAVWAMKPLADGPVNPTILLPGTTPIIGGTNTKCEYNNNGVLGEETCGAGGSPGGASGDVQSNQSSAFYGDSNFTYAPFAGGNSGGITLGGNAALTPYVIIDSAESSSASSGVNTYLFQRAGSNLFDFGVICAHSSPPYGCEFQFESDDATNALYQSLYDVSGNSVLSSNWATSGKAVFEIGGLGVGAFPQRGYTGCLSLGGATSGDTTICPNAIAGSASIIIPTNSGTIAVSASSPLVLNATTGNLTCSTCITGNQTITLSGDTTGSGTTAITTTTGAVNGVTYPSGPATNTVPVVAGTNTVTYEAVPNAALANASATVGGQTCTLGSSCKVYECEAWITASGTMSGSSNCGSVSSGTWTGPSWMTSNTHEHVEGLAGGGGGGGCDTSGDDAGSGSAGGAFVIDGENLFTSFTFTIGAGGVALGAGTAGAGNGGNTTTVAFSSTTYTATGGTGGITCATSAGSVAGASASQSGGTGPTALTLGSSISYKSSTTLGATMVSTVPLGLGATGASNNGTQYSGYGYGYGGYGNVGTGTNGQAGGGGVIHIVLRGS